MTKHHLKRAGVRFFAKVLRKNHSEEALPEILCPFAVGKAQERASSVGGAPKCHCARSKPLQMLSFCGA